MIQQASKLDTQKMSLKDIISIVFKSYPQLLLEAIPYLLRQ
jgi:hypothetical protein